MTLTTDQLELLVLEAAWMRRQWLDDPPARAPWAEQAISVVTLADSGELEAAGTGLVDAIRAVRALLDRGLLVCEVPDHVRRDLEPERCWVKLTPAGLAFVEAYSPLVQALTPPRSLGGAA